MYHYTECGLDYVYLLNGFRLEKVDGEEYSSIDDTHGLHRVIGLAVARQARPLDGSEIRFLRVEMNMTQKALGDLLGVDGQTLARWEKGEYPIPKAEDVVLRAYYLESISEGSPVGLLLQMLASNITRDAMSRLEFQEDNSQWRLAS